MSHTAKAHQLVLVGGGARSGKSSFALTLARRLGSRKVLLATAEASDPEMEQRIAEHRRRRGSEFRTVEEPLAVPTALAQLRDSDVVVLDCLTLWLANLLVRKESSDRILAQVDHLIDVLSELPAHAIVVTNEVGMGLVPDHPLGRVFRDVCGWAHQRLSRHADQIYFAVLGNILRLKPGPVEVHAWEGP